MLRDIEVDEELREQSLADAYADTPLGEELDGGCDDF
jgi:hypothetical protein